VWIATTALGAESRHNRLEGPGTVAEALGGVIERKAIDEDGAQRLIAAVESLFGLMKESSAHLVIHDAGLAQVDELSTKTSRKRYPKSAEARSGVLYGSRTTP
jgi:hypothetical protein